MLGEAEEVQASYVPSELVVAIRRTLPLGEARVTVRFAPIDPVRRVADHFDRIASALQRAILRPDLEPIDAGLIDSHVGDLEHRRASSWNLAKRLAVEQNFQGRSLARREVLVAVFRAHCQYERLAGFDHRRDDGVDEPNRLFPDDPDRLPARGQQPPIAFQVDERLEHHAVIRPRLEPQSRSALRTVTERDRHRFPLFEGRSGQAEGHGVPRLERLPLAPRLARRELGVRIGTGHRHVASGPRIVRLDRQRSSPPECNPAAWHHRHVPDGVGLAQRNGLRSVERTDSR